MEINATIATGSATPFPQDVMDALGAYQKYAPLRSVFSVTEPVTVVAGTEDSGKSSLVCNILWYVVAPSKSGTATKKLLLIRSLQGDGPSFTLLENNKHVLTSPHSGDIYNYLEQQDEEIQVTYDQMRELQVKIGGVPLSLVDLPGYQTGVGTKSMEKAITSPGGRKTSLVLCVSNLRMFKCNPRSDGNIEPILQAAKNASAEALLVLTHADFLLTSEIQNPVTTLIKNVKAMKEALKRKGIEFEVVLVKCKDKQGGWEFPAIRAEEQEIWKNCLELQDAKDSEGKPLFQCGVGYIQNLIFSGPFMGAKKNTFERAESILQTMVEQTTKKINNGMKKHKLYELSRPMVSTLESPANVTKCTATFQNSLHRFLRDSCENIFQTRDVPVPATRCSPTWASDIQEKTEDVAMQDISAYRNEIKVYITRISDLAPDIFEMAVRSMKEHLEALIKAVDYNVKVSEWIMGHFDAFVAKTKDNTAAQLKEAILLHTYQSDFKPREWEHWSVSPLTKSAKENKVMADLVGSLETVFGHMQFQLALLVSKDLYFAFPNQLEDIMIQNKNLEISQAGEEEINTLTADLKELKGAVEGFSRLGKRARDSDNETGSPKENKKRFFGIW
jgi:hypothetical protein